MLVLSRRVNDKIVFPALGITVKLLRINGQVVRIGVDAPPSIRVLREELADAPPVARRSEAHELRNRFSHVTLALHLFRRQREAGLHADAELTLARIFNYLAALERDAEGAAWTPCPGPSRGEHHAAASHRPSSLRALLVDDDSNERELLAGVLRLHGCECATAVDGNDALQYLAAHDLPDVVLLDMFMPGCDGPTALRAIRSEPRFRGLQVFGVSGSSPRDLGLPTGPCGVDGWFAKPLNPRALLEAMHACRHTPATGN